LLDSCRQRNGY
jgi:Gly-Xaa carboxypeptidase